MNGLDSLATVLLLDEDGTLAPQIAEAMDGRLRLIRVARPEEAVAVARAERVHVFLMRQRNDGGAAMAALRHVRHLSPCTLAVLLAGNMQRSDLMAGVREGDLFRVAQDVQQLRGFMVLAADQSRAFYTAALPAGPGREISCVLVLDEETATAERVREALRLERGVPRAVYWCDTLYEAFDALARRDVGLLVTDVRLDGEDISGGLRTLHSCHPEVSTLIYSSEKNTATFSDLLDNGSLLLPKPASRERLAGALSAALHPLASPIALAPRSAARGTPGITSRVRLVMEKLGWRHEEVSAG